MTELPINEGLDDSFDTDEDFDDETAETNQSEMNHVLENYQRALDDNLSVKSGSTEASSNYSARDERPIQR